MINSKTIFLRLFTFLVILNSLVVTSCQNEGINLEDQNVGISDENGTGEENSDIFNPDGTLNINTEPSAINLNEVQSGDDIAIEGRIDLNGQNVVLPSNVTLRYNGGEIINGTLDLGNESQSVVDGNLLNSSLNIRGNIRLLQDVFTFRPNRWNIVQGDVDHATALQNTLNLEQLFLYAKGLGAHTFAMKKFDAYFEVATVTSTTSNQNFYPQKEAINIPSDFTLKMSDNTILRTFPTEGHISAALLAFDNVENSAIKGGVLYGERDIRTYSPNDDNAEEGTYLVMIKAGKNVTLDGVTFTKGSKGGVDINSYGFYFNSNYNPTDGVTIQNCTFDENRAIALAITDGRNITVQNNSFENTAQPTSNSDGGVVGYAIDIEPIRTRDNVTGEIIWWQYVENVIIQNNTEYNSREGSFTIYAGNNIQIDNNDVQNTVSWSYPFNSKVINNTFTAVSNPIKPAIIAGGSGDSVFNNEISGNTINNYGTGISANHRDIVISNNTLNNCITGIQFKNSADMQVFNNTFQATTSGCRGIMGHLATMNNIEIYNNVFNITSNALYFVQLNKAAGEENNMVYVHDNNFDSAGPPIFSNSNGINLQDNMIGNGVQLTNASNVTISGNIIDANSSNGISLTNANYGIQIINNDINYPQSGNYQCIYIQNTTSTNEVSQVGNSCN